MEEITSFTAVKLEYGEEVDLELSAGNREQEIGVCPGDGELEVAGALVVVTSETQEIAGPRPQLSAVSLKAKRLSCINPTHKHLRKKKGTRRREEYGIDGDSGELETVHRNKLRHLLKSLMEQRRWTEACGALGVLVGIGYNAAKDPSGLPGCRSDYWAAMTVLRRVDDSQSNALRCRRMFRLLNRHMPNARCRGEIQLESALYLMNQGDREAAYNELRPLADGPKFREDPVVNLCHGLNTHWLWYEAAVQESSKSDLSEIGEDIGIKNAGRQEVIGETEAPEPSVDLSSGTNMFRAGSPEGSVMSSDSHCFPGQRRKFLSRDSVTASTLEMDSSARLASQRSLYEEETDEEGFVHSGEQVWLQAAIPLSQGLDPRLFPIRVARLPSQKDQLYRVIMNDGRTRDLHATSVKHLKQALQKAPDMLPALLPLVQLLLAIHDVKGAVYEIDKCAQALKNHVAPPSMKAIILESLKHTDHALQADYYRKVLSINPFSLWGLKGIIKLQTSGKVGTAFLLDSISLHLDATPGSADVWRKLASSLLEVGKTSSALALRATMNSGGTVTGARADRSPASRDYLQKLWSSPRHEWWIKKHFSDEIFQQHQQEIGDRWLLAYKAACAAHIYGPDYNIVRRATTFLELHGDDSLHKYVKRHSQSSLKVFADG